MVLFLLTFTVLGNLRRPALGGLTRPAMMKSGGLHITRIKLKAESLIQLMIPQKIGGTKNYHEMTCVNWTFCHMKYRLFLGCLPFGHTNLNPFLLNVRLFCSHIIELGWDSPNTTITFFSSIKIFSVNLLIKNKDSVVLKLVNLTPVVLISIQTDLTNLKAYGEAWSLRSRVFFKIALLQQSQYL